MLFFASSHIQRFLPRIKVHAWGGFGSQIFACLVARRLKNALPGRKIILVFHTSGVTRRNLELPPSFLSNFRYKILRDFAYSAENSGNVETIPNEHSPRKRSIKFLQRIGVLARLNSEKDFSKLFPWIMEVRGHYTEISLSLDEVKWVSSMLGLKDELEGAQDHFSIHFRLGDLLNLPMKTHISVARVLNALEENHYEGVIDVYSDSEPREVENLLNEYQVGKRFSFHRVPSIEVIEKCVESRFFVGTNSKISLWISILRIVNGKKDTTQIPVEILRQVEVLLGQIVGIHQLRKF